MQNNISMVCAYTVKDFCRAYAIGRTKAYAEISGGRLRAKKVGSRTLIMKADAEAWAEALPSRGSHHGP